MEQVIRSLALGLFARAGGIPEDRMRWLLTEATDFVEVSGPRMRFGFRLVLLILEYFPVFFIGRPARLSRLSPTDRDRYLAAIEASSLALLIALPKVVLGLNYYEHPDAVRETGYDGRCLVGSLPNHEGLVALEAADREDTIS